MKYAWVNKKAAESGDYAHCLLVYDSATGNTTTGGLVETCGPIKLRQPDLTWIPASVVMMTEAKVIVHVDGTKIEIP